MVQNGVPPSVGEPQQLSTSEGFSIQMTTQNTAEIADDTYEQTLDDCDRLQPVEENSDARDVDNKGDASESGASEELEDVTHRNLGLTQHEHDDLLDLLWSFWHGQQDLRQVLDEKLAAISDKLDRVAARAEIGPFGGRKAQPDSVTASAELKAAVHDGRRNSHDFDDLDRQLGELVMKRRSDGRKRGSLGSLGLGSRGMEARQDEGKDKLQSATNPLVQPSDLSILPNTPADEDDSQGHKTTPESRSRSVVILEPPPVLGKNGPSGALEGIDDSDPSHLTVARASDPQASDRRPSFRRAHSISAVRARGEQNNDHVSLSRLFQRRESQFLQVSVTAPQDGQSPLPASGDNSAGSKGSKGEEVVQVPTSRMVHSWVRASEIGAQLCGLMPWTPWDFADKTLDETATDSEDEGAPAPRRWRPARILSKLYHCFIMLLNLLFLGTSLYAMICRDVEVNLFCAHGLTLVTDAAVAFGSLCAVWTCGGIFLYEETAQIQVQTADHLASYVCEVRLEHQWLRDRCRDYAAVVGAWVIAVALRCAAMLADMSVDTCELTAVLSLCLYSICVACLLNACYVQLSMWRGLSLSVVAFARSVLEGAVTCSQARVKWREVISCMRHTSRMYQLTAAALALTTVLVFFGILADVQQDRSFATIIPNLLVAISLPSSLVVAARATAHCTRLPSLVSMLDGDKDKEAEYMELAMFLTVSESGFFMWDTRVTLGVVQRFLYFTLAIFGTIGFQTKVLSFETFG
mmetsp:Transcript_63353/g.148782  ORF Transcript_63353/g.148782 Transcript_63353/m.148782 type:complete len:749 (+) Transcript_63353:40-2286(+)